MQWREEVRAWRRGVPAAGLAVIALLLGAAPSGAEGAEAPSVFWTKCLTGSAAGQCVIPRGIGVDPSPPGHLYVADQVNRRIDEFTAWGEFVKAWGWDVVASGPGDDISPPEDQFEICVPANGDICKTGLGTGAGAGQFSGPPGGPQGAAVDSSGDVYVADKENHRVQKFDPDGHFLLMFGGGVITGGATGTGTVTSGETLVTLVATTSKVFEVGQTITGVGIEPGTTIVAIGSGTITLSKAAGPSATGTTTNLVVAAGAGNVPTNERQTVTLGANTTGGTFALTYTTPNPSPTTATATAIPAGASAAELESKLQGLSNIGAGNIAVTGVAGGPWTVEFKGTRFADTDVTQMTSDSTGLTVSSGSKSVTVTTTRQGAGAGEVCSVPADCRAGIEGTAGEGQFGALAFGSYISIEPASDIVYIGDQNRIQTFDASGKYLADFPDPEGLLAGKTVQGLAVSPAGGLYLARSGTADVLRLDAAGEEICTAKVASPQALATDPAGNLYVIDSTGIPKVLEFNSSCARNEVPAFGEDVLTNSPGAPTGIATGSACFSEGLGIYVSNPSQSNSFVRAYGPPPDTSGCQPPPAAPEIDAQYTTSAGAEEAVVGAQINPKFWSGSLGTTRYYVQYGTAKCIEGGWGGACVKAQPSPPGSKLISGPVDEPVATAGVFVGGLEPGTTYRYRFVAESTSPGGGPVFGEGGKVGQDGEAGSFTTFPMPEAPNTSCPNQVFRTGFSGALPDCRAYEMVSPLDKDNADIVAGQNSSPEKEIARLDQSAASGQALAYSSVSAFGGALGAPYTSQYIARRGEAGWQTEPISPPKEGDFPPGRLKEVLDNQYKAFSADLSEGWFATYTEPVLAPGGQAGYINLYRRDSATGAFEACTTSQPQAAAEFFTPVLQGVSADGRHAVFRVDDKLTGDANPPAEAGKSTNQQLYECEYANGAARPLRLVSVLPDETASELNNTTGVNNAAASYGRDPTLARAISANGSRIFWTAEKGTEKGEGPGALYVRIDGDETVEISADPAQFLTAAADGSVAIYSVGADLFEFDVDTETATLIAHNARGVLGASEDASHLYFVSEEDLDLGGPATAGKPNLYLYEAGEGGKEPTYTFIATLSGLDIVQKAIVPVPSPVQTSPRLHTALVSPDGAHLAFMSVSKDLSELMAGGYDNTDAGSGEPDAEVYRYDAASGDLACVSCNRSGARPAGREIAVKGEGITGLWAAAQIPAWESSLYAPRALSDDGRRIFFESFEALVLGDTNGREDVYQWEQAGSGDCDEGDSTFLKASGGCITLISSGQSSSDTEFVDAGTDGKDVFIRTGQSLLPQDPGLVDIYDARVGGGFPPPVNPPPACEGETCQGATSPPDDPTPASSTFEGDGNLVEGRKPRCAKGKARRKGRCVAKHKRHHRRAAGSGRRGQR